MDITKPSIGKYLPYSKGFLRIPIYYKDYNNIDIDKIKETFNMKLSGIIN